MYICILVGWYTSVFEGSVLCVCCMCLFIKYQVGMVLDGIPYACKFSWDVYFADAPNLRIFAFLIS